MKENRLSRLGNCHRASAVSKFTLAEKSVTTIDLDPLKRASVLQHFWRLLR